MAELYLLGGATLCGKSEITKLFLRRKPIESVNTNGIRRILWKNLDEQQHADLFVMFKDRERLTKTNNETAFAEDPEYFATSQFGQSHVVWNKGVRHYIDCNMERHINTLVKGVAVLPELVALLPYPHRAVFIGNQNIAEHLQAILPKVRADKNHWMYGWSDKKIESYMHTKVAASKLIETQAKQYGYTYFEMSAGDFEDRKETVVSDLLNSAERLPVGRAVT